MTVSEGRQWLERYCRTANITEEKRIKINTDFLASVRAGEQQHAVKEEPAIQLKDVWFRYEKDSRMWCGTCHWKSEKVSFMHW